MPQDTPDIGSDLIIGADSIARALNWYRKDGTPHKRRVYHVAEKKRLPIHHEPGLGLVMRKSALRAYFDRLDERAFGSDPEATQTE